MSAKIFNISLPEELLVVIDQQVKLHYTSRSEYVKGAILTRLHKENALYHDPGEEDWRETLAKLRKRQLREGLLKNLPRRPTRDDSFRE